MNVPPRPAPDQPNASNRSSGTRPFLKAYRSPHAWWRFLVPAVVGLAADLFLKHWAFPDGVPPDKTAMLFAGRNSGEHPWTIIPHVLGFTTTVNQGAVFGFAQGKVSVFLAFSILALAVILWVFATSGATHRVVHFALGLITAGALGNLYDRAMYHGVRDMLRFLCFHFHLQPITILGYTYPSGPAAPDGTFDWYPFIFNIADACLCVGVPLLIVRWLFVNDTHPASAMASDASAQS